MKQDDVVILKEIQKNTQMAMKAIDTLPDKVLDDEFLRQLSKQSLRYSEIHNEATDKLVENDREGYHGNYWNDMMLKSGIHMKTAFNVSTGHLSEMMIQGSNRGITSMWKIMKHHQLASNTIMEIAEELVSFEENNVKRLREFL